MYVFGKDIYLRVWQMRAGQPVVVEEVTRGHLKSSCKVISRDKGDLTETLKQVCVWYHRKGDLSGSLITGYWDAGSGGIFYQRLLKVTNQGHLKR